MNMTQRPTCKWFKNGKCIHFERRKYCKPSDETWFRFAEPLHPTWVDRVCELEDPMQPRMYKITDKDIEALKNGQILHIVSPSPFFIAYMEDTPDE